LATFYPNDLIVVLSKYVSTLSDVLDGEYAHAAQLRRANPTVDPVVGERV
jgi:hypothetical protein